MSELTLFLIKISYLAILWIFVLSAISVVRSDMFGARMPATAREAAAPKARRQPKQKARKGSPTHVLVVDGANKGERADLAKAPILIGRGNDAAIRLDDDYVSTRHARIAASGDQWFVEDLGSTNGTYIGSARITQPTTFTLGTQVRIGKNLLELRKRRSDCSTPRSPTSGAYARTTRTPGTPGPGCSPCATESAARPGATSPRAPRSVSCVGSTSHPTTTTPRSTASSWSPVRCTAPRTRSVSSSTRSRRSAAPARPRRWRSSTAPGSRWGTSETAVPISSVGTRSASSPATTPSCRA